MQNSRIKTVLYASLVFLVGWLLSFFFHTKEIKIEDKLKPETAEHVSDNSSNATSSREDNSNQEYQSRKSDQSWDQEKTNNQERSNRNTHDSRSSAQLEAQSSTMAQADMSSIPSYARETLRYIRANNRAPEGYVGGRTFQNREGLLPKVGSNGERLSYREWDVHPKEKGKNRGTERLVTSSQNDAYFTSDHYRSFIKVTGK